MMESIFIGMSGLHSASRGLNNISNNVANLNTAGYKRFELNYHDVGYRADPSGADDAANLGSGVTPGVAVQVHQQGEFRQTGNDLDVAVEGNGMFVVRRDDRVFYTRAGQFSFDDEGMLTSRDDASRVCALNNGQLVDVSLAGRRSTAPVATRTVEFSETLSINDTTFTVSNVKLVDSLGVEHTLTLEFTNNQAETPGEWKFVAKEEGTVRTEGRVRYGATGQPEAEASRHVFTYDPGDAADMEVTLDFAKTSQFSASGSSLKMATQDGKLAGFLTKTTFDADGFLVLDYSNGEKVKAEQLALAFVQDSRQLVPQGENRFSVADDAAVSYGVAKKGLFGTMRGGGLEASNVDLAHEFGELIIAQRSYQASSQVISAANEMIQQLSDLKGRR